MIIDVCAHTGFWAHRPIGVEADGLAKLLAPWGVGRVFHGRLEALWLENPHDANRLPERRAPAGGVEVVAVPVLDPTIATWADELDRLAKAGPLRMVRLYPSYGSYTLAEAGALLDAVARRKVIAQVIVRIEDVRRQHRLAQIPDVAINSIIEAAERHPELTILASGISGPDLRSAAGKLPKTNNLWADTSQADGCGTVATLAESGWRERLVFGSHAPLFIPYAAMARVLLDLDDAGAGRILETNADTLFKEK